jgi:hypothetical protein
MLTSAHREILARVYATNIPPGQENASIAFSAEDIEVLIEALVAIDPDEIPQSQTQNVLGWVTSICSQSGAAEHVLDPLVEVLRGREIA